MTGTAQPPSPLERSRAKSSHARSDLDTARTRLSELDGQLGRNAAQTGTDETALRAAMDEIKRLKKALKDGEKQRRKLLTARKRAADAAEKAEERVRKAEAKYDRAVLADLIQRQKEQDRGTASAKAPANGSTVGSAEAAPAEDLGTATARETAARTTAESAGDTTAAAPRTTASPRSTTSRRASSGRTTTPRTTTPRTTTARTRTPRRPSGPEGSTNA